MKKVFLFLALIVFLGMNLNINAQLNNVTLSVSERYDSRLGPVGVSAAFTTGYVTVVAISAVPMYYKEVYIQFAKMDKNGEYQFYKRFPFSFPYGYKTVYFSRSDTNDMEFEHTGNYVVYLLDATKDKDNVIAYTLVKIVD